MRNLICALLLSMGLWCAGSLAGRALADDAEDQRQARLQEMRRRAEQLKLGAGKTNDTRAIKLRGEPLLRFDDPTRAFADGTLWAWVDRGRPHALVSVERYEKLW